MMTEVAGCRQVRRPAILVSAIAGNGVERVDCRLQVVPIGMAQTPCEQAACVVDVIALAEPGADDHGRDARLFEHVPACNVGDRDAVTRGNGSEVFVFIRGCGLWRPTNNGTTGQNGTA